MPDPKPTRIDLKNLSRRDFLKFSGLATLGLAAEAACASIPILATLRALNSPTPVVPPTPGATLNPEPTEIPTPEDYVGKGKAFMTAVLNEYFTGLSESEQKTTAASFDKATISTFMVTKDGLSYTPERNYVGDHILTMSAILSQTSQLSFLFYDLTSVQDRARLVDVRVTPEGHIVGIDRKTGQALLTIDNAYDKDLLTLNPGAVIQMKWDGSGQYQDLKVEVDANRNPLQGELVLGQIRIANNQDQIVLENEAKGGASGGLLSIVNQNRSDLPLLDPKTEGFYIPSLKEKGLNPFIPAINEELLRTSTAAFANAFGVKPEDVGNLTPQLLTGVDGKQFVVLTTGDLSATATFNESGTPLLIAEQGENGEWGWKKIDTGNVSALTDVPFGLGNIMEGKYYYYQFTPEEKDAQMKLSRVYSFGDVFQASAILWEGEGRYDWSRPDSFVSLLQNKGGKIRGGHLVWDKDAFPEWFNNLKNEAIKNPATYRERFIGILSSYIKAAVGRYKNNVHEWSVLNEIVGSNGNLDQNNFWVKIIGPDLPRVAIETVRSADPTARIVINEFGVEFSGPKSDGYYRLVKQLKEQGLLNNNDIVGFQFHISAEDSRFGDPSSAKDEIKRNLRRFIDLGVKVAITELDVMELWSNDLQSLIKQAEIYKSVVEACFELNLDYGKPVCDSVVVWGLKDDSTWLHYITDKPGYPLLFDNEGKPHPSYYVILGSYLKYLSTLTK